MDKTFEVELIRLARNGVDQAAVKVTPENGGITLYASNGLLTHGIGLLYSEAVTIGEQLIAAGKAGE